jgi:peptidoglycan/LPS O-acetylase OafA/YrhL
MAFGLVILSPFSRAVEYQLGSRDFTWLTSNADSLMIGCLTALAFNDEWVRKVVNYWVAAGRLCAIALLALPVYLTDHLLFGAFTVTLGPVLQSAAAAYLICSCIMIERGLAYQILNAVPISYVGRISYSLYIWQQIFFTMASDFGFHESAILQFPVNVICSLGSAVLSYYCIEQPFSAMRRSFAGRRDGRPKGVPGSTACAEP